MIKHSNDKVSKPFKAFDYGDKLKLEQDTDDVQTALVSQAITVGSQTTL